VLVDFARRDVILRTVPESSGPAGPGGGADRRHECRAWSDVDGANLYGAGTYGDAPVTKFIANGLSITRKGDGDSRRRRQG